MRVLPAIVLLVAVGGTTIADATAQSGAAEAGASSVHVWNGDIMELDAPGQLEQRRGSDLKPVEIVGARNGGFSGKLVVGSSGPVKGLTVKATDLTGARGAIPAANVLLRFGCPWSTDIDRRRCPAGYDILLEAPPAEFAAGPGGAIVPVWVTITVPKEVKAGTYEGRLAISAAGLKPAEAIVRLKVIDWTLPDSQQWRTWIDLIQSPDTLALEYNVPLWSDRHWQMVAKSFSLMGQTGCRIVYVPLICFTNCGNEQSMVRWVPKGEGRYEHDFTVLDKYLDLASTHMGRPKIIVLQAWETYMMAWDAIWDEKWWTSLSEEQRTRGTYFIELKKRGDLVRALHKEHGAGPAVSVFEPATEKVSVKYLPPYTDRIAADLWGPLFERLRARLKAKGLDDAAMFGMLSDGRPTQQEVAFLNQMYGGRLWASHSHAPRLPARGDVYGVTRVGYDAHAWELKFGAASGSAYGWKQPDLIAEFDRFDFNRYSLIRLRHAAERNITGRQRGIGRVGADLWWAVRDTEGRRQGAVWTRYEQSRWRHLDILSYILAPGPAGPVGTARLEIFREGIQECEARIFLEGVLADDASRGTIGAALATRGQETLQERLAVGDKDLAGWRQRTEKLYNVAAEVVRALSTK